MSKIFGFTGEQIRKQLRKDYEVDPEYKMGPINPNDTLLEPCLRGAQKILDNPERKEMVKRVLRGA